jgi:hypothetical protein
MIDILQVHDRPTNSPRGHCIQDSKYSVTLSGEESANDQTYSPAAWFAKHAVDFRCGTCD